MASLEGTVAERMRNGVRVEMTHDVSDTVLTWQSIVAGATWRIDLTANTVTHDRMVDAVKIATDPDALLLKTDKVCP